MGNYTLRKGTEKCIIYNHIKQNVLYTLLTPQASPFQELFVFTAAHRVTLKSLLYLILHQITFLSFGFNKHILDSSKYTANGSAKGEHNGLTTMEGGKGHNSVLLF